MTRAEEAVLGSMLLSREAAETAGAELRPEDFAGMAARTVFIAMQGLMATGGAVDMATVLSALEINGALKGVGGAPYIAKLGVEVPSAANVRHYIGIVQDASRRRTLIQGLSEAAKAAKAGEDDYIAQAQGAIEAAQAIGSCGVEPVGSAAFDAVGRIGAGGQGHETGFDDWDYLMGGGAQDGDLIIIGARPSMGKTAFALTVALHMALAGEAVAVITLEMSREQLLQRAAYSLASRDKYEAMRGIGAEDMVAAAERLSKTRLYVEEPRSNTPDYLRAICYRIKQREKRLGLVVVDYLQLMGTGRRTSNRNDEVSEISRRIKLMAKDLGCPVMLLSQLNREVERRPNRRPAMSDLRDSGGIEQDADVIGFLYRHQVYDPNADPKAAELIVAKNRNGGLKTVNLIWDGPYMRFRQDGYTDLGEQVDWEDIK